MNSIKRCLYSLAGLALHLACVSIAQAEVTFKNGGFLSVVAGSTVDGSELPFMSYECPCYIADWTHAGVYDDDGWTFNPDSRVGVQSKMSFNDKTSITAQLVSNGGNEYRPELNWLYLSQDITPEWSIDIGRKRLPLFYYSDFVDVGYALPWIRVPGDVYGWPIPSYNGISTRWMKDVGTGSILTTFWIGEGESTHNRSYEKLIYGAHIDIEWSKMLGASFEYSYDFLTVRVVAMNHKNTQEVFDPSGTYFASHDEDNRYYGIALNLEFEQWLVHAEHNQFKFETGSFESKAYFASAGYKIGSVTPTLSYSKYSGTAAGFGDEITITNSFILRWDFAKSTDFKLQYDHLEDKSTFAFVGDSQTVALGVDYVF